MNTSNIGNTYLNLLTEGITVVKLVRECQGYTREIIEQDLNNKLSTLLDFLSSLNIIPKTISIYEDNNLHQGKGNKFAANLNIELDYWGLAKTPIEERDRIHTALTTKTDREEHKKTPVKGNMHPHEERYIGQDHSINISANTEQEMIENLRKEIWQKIGSLRLQEQPAITVNVKNVFFKKTPQGYEAKCVISCERTVTSKKFLDGNDHYVEEHT